MDEIIVLTGASGVIGTPLLKKLSEKYNILVVTTSNKVLNESYNKHVDYLSRDKLDAYSLCSFFNSLENKNKKITLFNLGFPRSSDVKKLAQAIDDYENLLSLLSTHNLKKTINVSSQSVYDQEDVSIKTEKSMVLPNSNYGLTKYMTEKITKNLCSNAKIDFVNIRLGSVTGFQYPERIINRLVKKILNNESMIVDIGDIFFSFLSVEDTVDAFYKLITYSYDFKEEVYNLGNNDFIKLDQLAKKINNQLLNQVTINYKSSDNIYSNRVDSSSFYKEFMWKPKKDINKLISESIEYFKE